VPRLHPSLFTEASPVAIVYCPRESVEHWQSMPSLVVLDSAEKALTALRSGAAQAIVFDTPSHDDRTQHLLEAAWRHGLASAYYLRPEISEADPYVTPAIASGQFERDPRRRVWESRQLMLHSDFVLYNDESARRYATSYGKRAIAIESPPDRLAASLVRELIRARQPRVSVVSILYDKEDEAPLMLRSLFEQTYAGEIEIIFVDDRSPDRSVEVVERFVAEYPKPAGRKLPTVSIIRSELNRGNCTSRNLGIAGAGGDLIVVIDADCIVNRDFVRRHVDAHAFGDCEVTIGPFNIETGDREPAQVLAEYEAQPWLALEHADLQDPVNRPSFLNCITRNFCINRSAIRGELFDPLFSYSADPATGFGWEDVEMGYRLHQQGARIRFVADAFSIHISPPAARPDPQKPVRSLRNFRRLFEKHPEFAMSTHRWSSETLARIDAWARSCNADVREDVQYVAAKLALPGAPAIRTKPRRLRVLTYRWHVPHQYELYKLPFDFTLVTNLGSPMSDKWDYGQRPFPVNARMVEASRVDPKDFDLAILHFDENVLAPENTNGVIGPEWGAAFRWFLENVRLPSVAVCHGTPQFHGQYRPAYSGADLMQPIEAERIRLVQALADMMVVCNSHQAEAEWRFQRSRTIWHGFDPAEFPPATYERGILSPLGPLVMSRPHYRGYYVYRQVFDGLQDELRPHSLHVAEPHFAHTGNGYAEAKYRLYVNQIRRYSVYFNPTLRSPMPRARTEPMMCGVVPVSAKNHDVDRYIKNGVNGFYSEDPRELRDQLLFLHKNPAAVRRIGAEARRTACTVFNYDRYLNDWLELVDAVAGTARGA
jgi:glycosyltransferase involved in cell wall biosynthesis